MINMKIIREMRPKTVLKLISHLRDICDENYDPIFVAKKLLKKGVATISEDYSNYEDGKSSDGGKYGFWENANLHYEKGRFYIEITHHTTCDGFDYCSNCGIFSSSIEHEECEPSSIFI